MSDEGIARNIVKFDGTNFQLWKFQIRALFDTYGIRDVVDGQRTKPDDLTSSAGKMWVKDNARAMCCISTAIEYTQLEFLITCTTAREMWEKLCMIHEQTSEANKLSLMKNFHEYRMNASDPVSRHVAKIMNIANQLKDVGETVSDVAIMAKILGSLPTKFHAFVTAWDSVPADQQTILKLQERLITEEKRLNEMDEAPNVMAATSSQGWKKEHTSTKKKNPNNLNSRGKFTCWTCGKEGHLSRNCRSKKKKSNEQIKGRPNVDNVNAFVVTDGKSREKVPPDEVICESMLNADIDDVWITDSGASRHITFRREWFSEFRECHNIEISLGDNAKCQAKGIGSVRIKKYVNGRWEDGRIDDVLYVPKIRKNLFSVGVCTTKGFQVNFVDNFVNISRNGCVVAQGVKQENEICRMFFVSDTQCDVNTSTTNNLKIWHERLGHINVKLIASLIRTGLIIIKE